MGSNKRSKKVLAAISMFILLCGIGAFFFFTIVIDKPLKSKQDLISIEVKNGEGFNDVLNRLDNEGKISNKLVVKVYLALKKPTLNMAEGVYEIKSNTSLPDLLETLEGKNANDNAVKLTIPEGTNVEEIAELLQKANLCTADEFITEVKNYDEVPSFVKKDNNLRYSLEGFLYPDTYLIPTGTKPNQIIEIMLNRFKEIITQAETQTGKTLQDSEIFDIVTKAAMIEEEAASDEDRPLISSVIDNRLAKEMRLQLDATVLYSLGEHRDKVYYKDLEKDSPYNTYKYKGLPVGPITNPGIKSIVAAIKPAQTDYIYYIVNNEGIHDFTNSYEDFLAKRKQYGYDD